MDRKREIENQGKRDSKYSLSSDWLLARLASKSIYKSNKGKEDFMKRTIHGQDEIRVEEVFPALPDQDILFWQD